MFFSAYNFIHLKEVVMGQAQMLGSDVGEQLREIEANFSPPDPVAEIPSGFRTSQQEDDEIREGQLVLCYDKFLDAIREIDLISSALMPNQPRLGHRIRSIGQMLVGEVEAIEDELYVMTLRQVKDEQTPTLQLVPHL